MRFPTMIPIVEDMQLATHPGTPLQVDWQHAVWQSDSPLHVVAQVLPARQPALQDCKQFSIHVMSPGAHCAEQVVVQPITQSDPLSADAFCGTASGASTASANAR